MRNSNELGITTEQKYEIFAAANIVGGTMVVAPTRRAAEYWEKLQKQLCLKNQRIIL
ncbi:MAG: hypothetical protein ABI366_07155 [Ginsengibacter sp.]